MGTDNKPKSGTGNPDNKKRKQQYRPHNKSVKKGSYPLRPGVQGFFITCDGGRERQASQEAVQVIESFYEELLEGKDSDVKHTVIPNKPINKKIKFSYSDSESDDNNDDENGEVDQVSEKQNHETSVPAQKDEEVCLDNETNEKVEDGKNGVEDHETENLEDETQPEKKQRVETNDSKCEEVVKSKMDEKSVDKLIEDELLKS
ncbi:hypothetical protein L2E82_42749 [Cichorium intybus]|uniref:Uncharacterized protein n=1 Tax=Cichorium intybus TaxID=13427 RepID=A0ACB8ZMF1_CICIN|nr:hypothetical protein L2E82_42749 [Cichorium intybus]